MAVGLSSSWKGRSSTPCCLNNLSMSQENWGYVLTSLGDMFFSVHFAWIRNSTVFFQSLWMLGLGLLTVDVSGELT